MLIRTQNKQRIVNSDQIIDIFISKTGTKLIANTTCYDLDASEIVLGEYEDRGTCLDILEVLLIIVSHPDVKWLQLPLGGDTKRWLEDSHHMAKKLY